MLFRSQAAPEVKFAIIREATRRDDNLLKISTMCRIAMTADAFSENVAECLQAGMNGHIAKPIDLKLVMKEIRRIKEEKK